MNDAVSFFTSKFRELLDCGGDVKPGRYYRPRPYRNAAVRFRRCSPEDLEGRRRLLLDVARLNVFLFPAHEIPGCDLLSDSGTTTMTMEQWSQLLLGDEAYGSNEGFFELLSQIGETFGPSWGPPSAAGECHKAAGENVFIFHQGRAAEHALFGVLSRLLREGVRPVPDLLDPTALSDDLAPDLRHNLETRIKRADRRHELRFIIPSNSHFDTTEANIDNSGMLPLNLPCGEHAGSGFKGNIDTAQLRNLLEVERDRVPLIYVTITNNPGGGQPVSMANIREVRAIADEHGVPFLLDACRFAENAWFIQQREDGYRDRSIPEIVHETFGYADGFHISFKKDGLVNMGGGIVLKETGRMAEAYPELRNRLTDHQILTEGHPTYGGLAGRDLKGLVQGLRTVVGQAYLDCRIGQVQRFGDRLAAYGIPIVTPVGGHAVYLDVDRFFEGTGANDAEFRGIALTALLLLAGHRFCELGLFAFGTYADGVEVPPEPRVNFVRGAVPRMAYEDQDLFAAAEAVRVLYEHRDRIPAVDVLYGQDLALRHFKSRFRFRT
jgi:tryptophanase